MYAAPSLGLFRGLFVAALFFGPVMASLILICLVVPLLKAEINKRRYTKITPMAGTNRDTDPENPEMSASDNLIHEMQEITEKCKNHMPTYVETYI
ncbi:hypothetical protein L596_000382 [Steinernema carpocapsae]|uniref:Uncharacterized protein n=1 Tax=Steinernema carpocapsae TaxID=34508 RepID=A0A4U8UIU9_STECR|nr:hypothetical protein L596_000382 [Steinernema carpocapsae]